MATDSKTQWRVANYKILIYTHLRLMWHLRLAENRHRMRQSEGCNLRRGAGTGNSRGHTSQPRRFDTELPGSARKGRSTYLRELLTIAFRIIASRESPVYGVN